MKDKRRCMLFFDIDGTLIDPKTDFKIPESAMGAIRKLQRAGHLAVVNTGRTASFMENCIIFDCFCDFYYRDSYK